jgi:DNA-binding beta-propeller fold protein YncE
VPEGSIVGPAVVTAGADLPVGTELAGYRVEALVGRGGMGVVFRALDLALDRPVALKILAPELAADVEFRERFLRESRLAASIDHPNVIPVYDAGEVGGELYIAMRFVEGSDLKQLIVEGPLSRERALAIVAQVAAALDAAHARGLVHRDVKPSNVLVSGDDHVYLADFGLTRRLGEQALAVDPSRSLGTADYVAPEQIRGDDVDGRADLYSLGCLLFECLTGKPPFRRDSEVATLFAHLEEEPPELPGLVGVMRTALAKDPDDRYQSGRELVEAAGSALGLEAKPVRWPLVVVAVGLAVVAAAVAAFFATQGGGSPSIAKGRLLRIDPSSSRVADSVPVPTGIDSVAVGSGRVWAGSYANTALWQFDPLTKEVASVTPVGQPTAVTIFNGGVYVSADAVRGSSANVSQFDAREGGGRVDGVPVDQACSLTSGSYGLWLAGCPKVEELSSVGGSLHVVKPAVEIPYAKPLSAANQLEALTGLAEGANSVWALGDAADRRLWRIDPVRHRISATISLGFPPASIAFGDGAAWVIDELDDRLVKIDPQTNRVVDRIEVGRGAAGVAYGDGSVWVADAIEHAITRVDARSGRVLATIPLPASPHAVAVAGNQVWVAGDAR